MHMSLAANPCLFPHQLRMKGRFKDFIVFMSAVALRLNGEYDLRVLEGFFSGGFHLMCARAEVQRGG